MNPLLRIISWAQELPEEGKRRLVFVCTIFVAVCLLALWGLSLSSRMQSALSSPGVSSTLVVAPVETIEAEESFSRTFLRGLRVTYSRFFEFSERQIRGVRGVLSDN